MAFVFEKPLEDICEKFHVSFLNLAIMHMFEHAVEFLSKDFCL